LPLPFLGMSISTRNQPSCGFALERRRLSIGFVLGYAAFRQICADCTGGLDILRQTWAPERSFKSKRAHRASQRRSAAAPGAGKLARYIVRVVGNFPSHRPLIGCNLRVQSLCGGIALAKSLSGTSRPSPDRSFGKSEEIEAVDRTMTAEGSPRPRGSHGQHRVRPQ
jgi:hypothetical protein